MRTIALATLLLLSTQSLAAQSDSVSISFENCLQVIRNTSADYGILPINIVETNIMRMVRFVLPDGSVLITCSRPDNKMIVTMSR